MFFGDFSQKKMPPVFGDTSQALNPYFLANLPETNKIYTADKPTKT